MVAGHAGRCLQCHLPCCPTCHIRHGNPNTVDSSESYRLTGAQSIWRVRAVITPKQTVRAITEQTHTHTCFRISIVPSLLTSEWCPANPALFLVYSNPASTPTSSPHLSGIIACSTMVPMTTHLKVPPACHWRHTINLKTFALQWRHRSTNIQGFGLCTWTTAHLQR